MTEITLEDNIQLTITNLNQLIDSFSLFPEKDMSILETEVKKLCEYVNTTSKIKLTLKNKLHELIIKVEKLEAIIKEQQKETEFQLKKLHHTSKGHSVYKQVIDTIKNNDDPIH